MTPLTCTIAIATCALVIAAVFTDVRESKIPNTLTLPFALLGLILSTVAGGWAGGVNSLLGLLLGLALFFVSAFLGRILGAGDCKLFAALGAFLGPQALLWVILYSMLAGGVLAVLVALWRGVLGRSLTAVWRGVYLRTVAQVPMDITTADAKMRMPYAIAICAGTLLNLWWHGLG